MKKAEVYTTGYISRNGYTSGGAKFFLDSKDNVHTLAAVTDFGIYGFTWQNIGPSTFKQFLYQLDKDYFMGKAAHKRGVTTGAKGLITQIENDIDESAENGDITKKQVENLKDDLANDYEFISACEDNASFDVLYLMFPTEIAETIYKKNVLSEIIEDSLSEEFTNDANGFWETCWHEVCNQWKKEEKEKKENELDEAL